MSQSRQLAAIMFTDIAGYTALMGSDEQAAFDLLRKNRELQQPLIEKHGGKLLKEIGDGILASFNSASDAVYCALEIQQNSQRYSQLSLRIGVHLGDVVFQNDDVFGDGVNIASRIESLAPIGGIYISESVFRNVENKKDIKAQFVGEKELKNVKHPINIFSVVDEKLAHDVHSNQGIDTKLGSEKSIAVLPFVNMSSEPEQEYFSDGLTEEVIADLSQISNLLVISRSSIMTFKGTTKNLKKISNELNVRYVLEGSVRKAGSNLRITAQLIEANTDVHLWAEKYTGSINDIFEIQENVSRSIVEALRLKLDQSERKGLSIRPITHVQAYELYKKAQYEIFQFKEDGLKRALKYLDKALKIEGKNPFIYSKMGAALLSLMNVLNTLDRSIFKKVRQLTEKIFELEPNSPRGHFLLGYLSFYEGNIQDAVIQVQTAYNSDPNDYDNLWLLILGYSYLGQCEQAEKYVSLMGEVDPYNPVYNALKGLTYYMKGDLEKAFDEIIIAYQMYPGVPQVQLYYAYFLVLRKDQHQAIPVLEQCISNTTGSIFAVIGMLFKAALGNTDSSELLTTEEQEKLKIDVEWSWLIADFYSLMEKNELALNWLEHAVNKGFINYPLFAYYDPFLDNIRNDPRFLSLMDKVKRQHEELKPFGITD